MKVRYRGHSCVEIVGQHHILIDPDFTHSPMEDVEYILVSHAHFDHIGKIGKIKTGKVIASEDVCKAALCLGVSKDRLLPVTVGNQIENIQILPGFSAVNGLTYKFFNLLYKHRLPDPGGTPLSFLIEDTVSLLHIGDANEFPPDITTDIFCVPWRTPPFGSNGYKAQIIELVKKISPKYVLPIHYDLPQMEADPGELAKILDCNVLLDMHWHSFTSR